LQAQANRGRAQAARAQILAAPRGRSLAQMFPWAPKRRRSTLPPWRSAKICLGPTLPYQLFSTSIAAISSRIACVADDNASHRTPPAVDFKTHTRFTAKVCCDKMMQAVVIPICRVTFSLFRLSPYSSVCLVPVTLGLGARETELQRVGYVISANKDRGQFDDQ
jgi:hypothetical protein